MRKFGSTAAILAAIVAIYITALVVEHNRPPSETSFAGSDSQAESIAQQNNPNYKPWFNSLFSPSPEVESGLFALQAGIGGLILGVAIGALWQRNLNRQDGRVNSQKSNE